MPIFFSYTPERLFKRLVKEFTAFCSSPSEDGLLSVIFPLNQLREWLCPGRNELERIKKKPSPNRTAAEQLYLRLENLDEFEYVRSLFNQAKHAEYRGKPLTHRMGQLHGARCGMMRCGDSFGVTHFTVDGKEVRDFLWPVYKEYFDYFSRSSVG